MVKRRLKFQCYIRRPISLVTLFSFCGFTMTSALRVCGSYDYCHSARALTCPICKHRFRDIATVREHIKNYHSPSQDRNHLVKTIAFEYRSQPDSILPAEASKFHKLGISHRNNKLPSPDKNPYTCSVCDRRFGRLFNLQRHQKNIHMPAEERMCLECPWYAI